jgi:murein DD-endopeptidase MepM/ murein hydrolase activator NlpD
MLQEPARSRAYKHGVIDHSLFIASQRAGLPDRVTMRLAQIFQWDVDFVLDIRDGDEFHVVFEELYIGSEFIGHGDILAAEFVNRGESFRAIRYTDAQGNADYYNPDGESMRKAFLRAPVEFSRISSNFNLRRVHPLFKRNMPHRGIDYAAPTGTPILAAGDGRVVTASRTQPNGNYVVIQHGEEFTTKYLHLSKFGRGIKSGKRVNQGQTIGYVGSTGWASGPHLHYEFLVNGVHQNPRTVQLPDAQPIPVQERARFVQSAEPLLALLDDFKQQVQLAYGR